MDASATTKPNPSSEPMPDEPEARPTGDVMAAGNWLPLLAVALLVVVAGIHTGLRATTELSPWKGGGFAMFSTIDSPGARHVRIMIDNDEDRRFTAFVPPELESQVDQLQTVSSESQARTVAAEAGGLQWWSADGLTVFSSPDDLTGEPGIEAVTPAAVQVDVLHTNFDSAAAEVHLELMHRVTVATQHRAVDTNVESTLDSTVESTLDTAAENGRP